MEAKLAAEDGQSDRAIKEFDHQYGGRHADEHYVRLQ